METHELKTWSEYYDEVLSGKKTFEVRKNDRDFQVGDILLLNKWDNVKDEYAGSQTSFAISYVLQGGQFGIEKDYCVLGLKPILPAGCNEMNKFYDDEDNRFDDDDYDDDYDPLESLAENCTCGAYAFGKDGRWHHVADCCC